MEIQNRVKALGSIGVLLVGLSVCGAARADAHGTLATDSPRTATSGPGIRVLHFPPDRSLGILKVRDASLPRPEGQLEWTWTDWNYLGPARRDVVVSGGLLLCLVTTADGQKDLSPLSRLAPDDLQCVAIFPSTRDPGTWTYDRVMPHLAHLTGLRCLIVNQRLFTQKDLGCVRGMKSLERLELGAKDLPEGGLTVLKGLESLQALSYTARISESELADLGDLPNLHELSISFHEIHGEALQNLARLPSLTRLHLFADTWGAGTLESLENLPSLTSLSFGAQKPMGNRELRVLRRLTRLEELRLPSMNNTDDGWAYLVPLQSLKKLNIKEAKVTDTGLVHLKKIPSLEEIVLHGDQVTDEGLKSLSELHNLKSLRIYGRYDRPVTDAGLTHLATLQSLEELIIAGAGITDQGLDSLARLPHLQALHMIGHGITDQGLGKLKPLQSLRVLSLNTGGLGEKAVGITLGGLSQLKALPDLRELEVREVRSSPARLDLSGLTNLEKLQLSMVKGASLRDDDLTCLSRLRHLRSFGMYPLTGISDAGMAPFIGLNEMTTLVVGGPGVTDQGLACVDGMRKLDYLNLSGAFTDAGLQRLEGHDSLRMLTVKSSKELSPAAIEKLHRSVPHVFQFSVQGNRTAPSGSQSAPKVGERAPPFSVKLLDGTMFHLRDERGKVVLLYFWATWCSPCRQTLPGLKEEYRRVHERHKQFEMIGLSLDDEENAWRDYLGETEPPWLQARIGGQSRIAGDYGVTGVPAFFLIGPDGRVLQNPESQGGTLEQEVEKALGLGTGPRPGEGEGSAS